ncbi:Nuclear receptor coactivator 2 [Araneus ventricosus]|uniref:Nuclear receptor coactivator 2 n=1 Tax=Araneus ventricosus TaxID=182803 RepID=A0A4Y2NFA6_ARAVE|nr:Nuclear receptor coactivator 2 [Araneus ventricosus]
MNISPNVNLERFEEADHKLQFQLNKCLNEKRRRESTQDYLEELAGYISASASDMCSLSANPDKCAILQETVNQIRQIKLAEDCNSGDDLQKSEVSSSNPTYLGNDLIAPFLLHALDGFLFVVNTDGKIEFVSHNVESFLKYNHENLIDKSIYNIIHVGDHARFSSNLLPMSIGNVFGWSEPRETVSKSSAFHCRFLIKPPEDQDETMEEKQTRVSQYETMQVSAVLLPHTEKNETEDIQTEGQNRLVCVARRLPPNEKSNIQRTEQFVTRLDGRGKIISIDTSCISSAYSQYLNKDLVGCIIQEMCHPDDFQKLTQHLKETLQQGSNTSGVYRLRLAHEKIIYVQTKSKLLNYNPMASEQEIIVANHTILRDSDHCLENNVVVSQRSNPSPASGSIVPSLSNNMNGNSYSFSSLSPQDFNLNDIGLDFLPSSSWDMSGGEGQDLDTSSLPTTLGAPSTPASISSVNSTAQQPQRTQHPSGSAFSPELLSGRGSPSTHSPAQLSATGSPAPGRVTPFSNSFPFSPVSSQTVSRTSSPAPNLIKREEPPTQGNDTNLSPIGGLLGEGQNSSTNATQKLRNLLTHGIEEADSSVPKTSSSEKMEDMTGSAENGFGNHNTSGESVSSHNENIILRELLNQEDDDMNDENSKNLSCDSNCNVAMASDLCSYDALQKRTINNNNNMLRKLLNNDEDKSFKKNQDLLIQQLLKTDGKVSSDMNNVPSGPPKVGGPSRLPNSTLDVMNSVAKRKSPDTPMEESIAKRPAQQNPQHAHLAGQNPMLASMLAQTPRTAPSVPTSIANAIVSQLPQERLPKNLEKKLVHTPYTGAPTSGTNSTTASQYNFSQVQIGTRSLLSTSLQQEVVTADSRGHVTLAPQPSNNAGYNQVTNFMNRMLSPGDNSQNVQLGNYSDLLSNNSQQQASVQNTANLLIDGLAEASRDPNNVVSANDPLLSDILDQVWSMEQDMNMATDDFAFFKLLEELPETSAAAPTASPRPPSAHDVQEKLAIQSIQKQLMSFEVQPGPANTSRNSRFQQPGVMTQSPITSSSYSLVNQYQSAPPAYSTSNPVQRTRPPGIPTVQTNTLNMTSQQMQQMAQMNSQRQALPPQYGGINNVNDLTPPMRRHLLEQQRHKLFLQQQFNQKKQLLMQQKQQQQQLALNTLNSRQPMPENIPNLQSPASSPFGENMNDLMNNTVAPNVTLQRSASMPEPQLSPRYSNVQQMPNSVAPPASPSQLSPGQRQQPPFSPLSQPGYPNNYPQARLSPHMQSQPGPTQTWVQRASQNPNLQQQNPMLNAQLSQQASFANQARFPSQQQPQPRQMIHSMPSPGARNSPFSNPPDSPFHPPSPGVNLYQQQPSALPPQAQQPQQRLQRAVSIPNRVNSPRGLPAGFTGGDPILSPQPSPGNYNPPASNYNATMPVSSSSTYNLDNFSYDQQVYPAAMIDRSRGNGGGAIRSEYVRQELRAKVGARTQQHQVHQQLVQQMPQATGSQSTNQSISQADFDALGFSLDLDNDGQPSSDALYPQSLLNTVSGTNSNDTQSRTGSPRFQMEEQRPAEQKKSLLQQLLSEPP